MQMPWVDTPLSPLPAYVRGLVFPFRRLTVGSYADVPMGTPA